MQDEPSQHRWQGLGAAVTTAMLLVLAAPGTVPWAGAAHLAWVGFVPLLIALGRASVRRAALLGLVAGLIFNLGLCPWFPGLLARFGDLNPALAVVVTVAVALYQAGGWAAWAALVRAASPIVPVALIAPAAFVAMERWLPMVFPYSLGITQYQQLWAAQGAELGGPYVLTGMFLLVSSALAVAIQAHRDRRRMPVKTLVVAALTCLLLLGFGRLRRSTIDLARREAPVLRVGAVQAGVVHQGWRTPPEDANALTRYQQVAARLERERGVVDLLLWPEKAYPLLLRADAARDYPSGHRRRVRRGFQSPLAFGVTSVDPQSRQVRNSVAHLDRQGRLQVVYDKVELIVYSEWVPSWMQGWVPGGKRYQAGTRLAPLYIPMPGSETKPQVALVSVFICFESSFPAHVRRLVARGGQLLANLSDDAWFGDSIEPEQHLSQAVFRAIESRRDLVRATGSGISAHITATGEILSRTPINRSVDEADRVLIANARLLQAPSVYGSARDALPVGCAALTATVLAQVLRRRRRRGDHLRRKPAQIQ